MAKQPKTINVRKVADALAELNNDRRFRVIVHDNTRGAGLQGWAAEAFATFVGHGGEGVLELAVGQLTWMPPTTRKNASAIKHAERVLPFTVVYHGYKLNPAGDGLEPEQVEIVTVLAANEIDAAAVFRARPEIAIREHEPRIVVVAAGAYDPLPVPGHAISGIVADEEPDPDDFYEE